MAAQTNQTVPTPPLGNRTNASAAKVYSQVVEIYASRIENPAVRLRFLNGTLAKQAKLEAEIRQSMEGYQFLRQIGLYEKVLEARLFSAILAETTSLPPHVRKLLPSFEVPWTAKLWFFAQANRHAVFAGGLVIAGILLFGLYSAVMWSGQRVTTYFARKYGKGSGTVVVVQQGQAKETPGVTSLLNQYEPEKVWIVKQDDKVESYSNGGRILRDLEIDNHPRAYYRYERETGAVTKEVLHEPIGIVYHTTENEIDSFVSDNNDSIQRRTQNILKYVRNQRAYHYVIDRYGEIHRIVRDNSAANHAGFSMWADGRHTYIGLNESFIGVAFDATMADGSLVETLTEAQVVAGRQLTNILRAKYKIVDANCTTHGLVSVNPDHSPGLIAPHFDWARNFPFEAMGLSDKYQVATPNIADYGFTWDEEVLVKLNKVLWPGALTAEEEFKKRVSKARSTPEALREKLRLRWKEQYQQQKSLQGTAVAQAANSDAAERRK